MKTIRLRLEGATPILLHSDRFADPLDPMARAHKALTSKRVKTEDDHHAIARSEWRGSLYWDDQVGVYVPGLNVEASFTAGARREKKGLIFKQAVRVLENVVKLRFPGDDATDPAILWDKGFYDVRSVVVSRARLMRYRPKFDQWACEVTVQYDPTQVDRQDLVRIAENAGQFAGLGDFRPRFGSYTVQEAA